MKAAIVKVAAIVAGTIAYAGLGVAGWGGLAAFFSHPALIALMVVLAAMMGVSFFAGGNLSSGEREDRGNRWVLIAFTLIGLLDAYVPALTDRRDFLTIDGDTVRWIGVVLFAVGGVLRLWPVFVLGDRFSGLVAIQPGHQLVTSGIYRHVRNPSYLGVLVMTLGWGLAFRSGVGVLLTVLLVPPLIGRMHSEEALLGAQFGTLYADYRARTWRLFPGVY
jgi:protein-S-isoprenylcysteine O-methyltransferase Ste14